VEALTETAGKQANTNADEEVLLTGETFPLLGGDKYYELRPPGQAHERIWEQLVERAVFSWALKNAPITDTLSFRAICLLNPFWAREKHTSTYGAAPKLVLCILT